MVSERRDAVPGKRGQDVMFDVWSVDGREDDGISGGLGRD